MSAAVDRLRDDYVPAAFGATADRVLVGGSPAEARDSFAVDAGWLPIVIAFVLTLSFVLLTLAFRSIAIPLTAIAVNLLSVGAAYGILVLVFQKGVGIDLLGFTEVERIDAWVPIFLFSVLFGLSMDYQVFLLSRIHERWSTTGDTPGAIVHGVASTARLITGAAAIIVVVFAGFRVEGTHEPQATAARRGGDPARRHPGRLIARMPQSTGPLVQARSTWEGNPVRECRAGSRVMPTLTCGGFQFADTKLCDRRRGSKAFFASWRRRPSRTRALWHRRCPDSDCRGSASCTIGWAPPAGRVPADSAISRISSRITAGR